MLLAEAGHLRESHAAESEAESEAEAGSEAQSHRVDIVLCP